MTIKYGYSKLALACASFLAFAGLTATVAARQAAHDAVQYVEPVRVQRIVIVQPRPTVEPAETSPAVQAAPPPVRQVSVPAARPVTRTRGS